MATKILIPTPLRPYTDKQDAVDAEGKTVGELLKSAGLTLAQIKSVTALSDTDPSLVHVLQMQLDASQKSDAHCRQAQNRKPAGQPDRNDRRHLAIHGERTSIF